MDLEDGEYFFMMSDGFVMENYADDLAYEFLRIVNVLTQKEQFERGLHQFSNSSRLEKAHWC